MPPRIISLPAQSLRRIHHPASSHLRSARQLHQLHPQFRIPVPSRRPLQCCKIRVAETGKAWQSCQIQAFCTTPARRREGGSEGVSNIDEIIEEIQEMYATARDEFEIAFEETEKNTTYAPDDRAAAREELDKLLGFYGKLLEGEDRAVAEEVKRRVGQRIRELEQGVKGLEEMALGQD